MLKRIGLLLCCGFLLFISWGTVLAMESEAQKQENLIGFAEEEIAKGTYVNAIPHLTQALAYDTDRTLSILEMLKDVYYQVGNARQYAKTLEQLVSYEDCATEIYSEYAQYFIDQNKLKDALQTLNLGIERTNDESLMSLYEEKRYAIDIGWDSYDDVTEFYNGGIQVMREGLWGLANSSGKIVIPFAYEQISTFDTASGGYAVALRPDKKVVTINAENQTIAISETEVSKIGNLSQNIIPLQLTSGEWILADSKLVSNNTQYEELGTAYNSAIALKRDGKWGVLSLGGETILPFEYDEIIMDELGRCYAQGAAFAKKDGKVHLLVDGAATAESYEDARPFANDGYAAVMKGGKWGFIDTSGQFIIPPQFEDAFSFNGHIAAIKHEGLWGYINTAGKIVIDAVYTEAKSFSDGIAPVMTEQGWQFITLLEYK